MLDRDIDTDDDFSEPEESKTNYESDYDYDDWKSSKEPTDYEMDIAQCKWDDEIWRGGEY